MTQPRISPESDYTAFVLRTGLWKRQRSRHLKAPTGCLRRGFYSTGRRGLKVYKKIVGATFSGMSQREAGPGCHVVPVSTWIPVTLARGLRVAALAPDKLQAYQD